jgi:phage terminase large subunit-like protein
MLNDSGFDYRSDVPALAAEDGSTELFDQVRARIIAPGGLLFFGKGVLLFPDLRRRTHLPLAYFLEDDSLLSKLVEYPRRHLKTTLVTISYTLWRFSRVVILGGDPIERIGIVSSTKPNAMRFLRHVKEKVVSHMFQYFLPELIPTFSQEEVWNQEEITFPREGTADGPSIDTYGAGTKATSRHYDGLIEDDLVNEENWDSPGAIKKAIEIHQLGENLLEDPNKSWRITNENSWTQFDVNSHIVKNEPETAVFSCGGTRMLNRHRSRHLPELAKKLMDEYWEDGDTLWPERFDRRALNRIRQKVGTYIYNAQYENDPFDPDVVDFKEEWLRKYEWTIVKEQDGSEHKALRLMPEPGHPMEVIPLRDLNVVAAWDPSLGRKTDSDRSAIAVVGIDPRERTFLLDYIAVRKSPLQVLYQAFDLVWQWDIRRLAIENAAFQRVINEVVDLALARWHMKPENYGKEVRYGVFEEVKPVYGKNKEGRIRYYVSVPFETRTVYIRDDQTDFLDEYTHFPQGATDDLLDAFAYSKELWSPGEHWEAVYQAAQKADDLAHARDPYTGY